MKEIDFIEEINGKLMAYEFKWKENAGSNVSEFLDEYKNAEYHIVNRENYLDFLEQWV